MSKVYCLLIYVYSYFIKLGTMFAVGKIPPAKRSNGKQNIQFHSKIDRQ